MKKPFLTLSFILLTLLVLGGCSSENEDLKTKIEDIPPIMPPSDLLKENYVGLIQCKSLYENHLFTVYRLLSEVDNKDHSQEFLESEELKKWCDISDDQKIRCGYIEKFKEKSNEIAISQDFSREDFWSEKDLAEFYAYKTYEFATMAIEEEELGSERIAKLQISDDLSTCMDYRDYVDGNLNVGIEVDNPEQLEEVSKKDFNELSLNDQAMMYIYGKGVKQDFKEAFRLLSIMAEEGNEYAQANLGLMYGDGKGVKKDYKKALYWFEKAAEQGNAGAITSLGFLYAKGHGVHKDLDEARRLYRLSAEQGNWMAHRKLGYMYKEGEGVRIDLVYALMWFILAVSSGDKVSDSEVYELRDVLDNSQISQANEMAEQCTSSEYFDCSYPKNEINWECPPSEYFKCVYSNNESNWDPLAFVCNYESDEPLTLQIENETLRIGSLDVKHQFKILKRNNSSIEWNDTSYMKVPFNVSHILDLENEELTFSLSLLSPEETKLDCLQVEENEIEDYEKDMRSVMVEEGWTPRLPPLSFYLKMAKDKDHPKVIHQMNLRCESLQIIEAVAVLSSRCDDLDILSKESEIKQCMGDSTFSVWKEMKNDLLYHVNKHESLNNLYKYLSNAQLQRQSSIITKTYNKSFINFLNKKEDENCWGDLTGDLCWEEEKFMCKKLREEKSLQHWFENLTSN